MYIGGDAETIERVFHFFHVQKGLCAGVVRIRFVLFVLYYCLFFCRN